MTRRLSMGTSDSEDLDILDEIKALDDLLSPKKNDSETFDNHIWDDNTNIIHELVPVQVVNNDCEGQSSTQKDKRFEACQAAFNCNKELISCLLMAKEEIKSILQECNAKLEIIDKNLRNASNSTSSARSIFVCNVGMPYFKDKDHFPAPKNQDVKTKLNRGELLITGIGQLCRWTPKDRKTLLNAIRHQAIVSVLHNNGIEDSSSQTNNLSHSRGSSDRALPKDFREMIGPLKSREFDWLKIGAADFECRHTAEECRVMWNIYLHPDINKSKWTKEEISRLKKIACKYNYQDWDQIAECLDTSRSGYQCFIKYNSEKKDPLTSNHLWTEAEDKQLLTLVDRFTIGNFIPWADITRYIRGRSKQQIYYRWVYSLAPHLKKGRFTKEEDKILLNAIGKFGKNFAKISTALMPHRTTAQLSDHYQTLIFREKGGNPWKLDEDMKLVELHEKFGSNWTKIAKYFSSRNRTQVRHRYSALKKKGFILDFVGFSSSDLSKEDEENEDYIDEQLIQYFRFVESSQPGRKQKFYRSEELETKTKTLHNILSLLNANLRIPDDLSDLKLSEKNAQLVYSLKDYREKLNKQRENNSEIVEQVRLKMFGPRPDLDETERFIPAPPFGILPTVSNKRTKSTSCNVGDNDKHVVDLKMDFDTPDNVLHFIGGHEKDLEFNKISLLLTRNSNRRNTSETLPVPNPAYVISKPGPSTSTCPQEVLEDSSSSTILCFPLNSDLSDTLRSEYIYPSYDTLTGYQNLQLWMKDVVSSSDSQVPEDTLLHDETPAGREAYELLEKRLLKLFKYPIGMSRISVPEIHGNDTSFIFDLHETESSEKGKKRTATTTKLSKKVRRNHIADIPVD